MEEHEEKKEDGSPENSPAEQPQPPDDPPESAPEPKHEEPPKSEEPPKQEAPPVQEEPSKQSERPQPQQDEMKKMEQEAPPLPPRREKMSVSVDQDTFVPPTSRRAPSGSVTLPRQSIPSGRRLSASERNLRKSRFGALSSKARMVLGSIVDIKTNAADYYDKKSARYQNTFKLDSDNPFNPEKVDKILREVLNEAIENLHYDPDKCSSVAKQASMQIRSRVKQLDFERYKVVCIVTIGEKNSQDVYATCRFLWDAEKDRYSFYSLENTHVYAIAYCFGLYYE